MTHLNTDPSKADKFNSLSPIETSEKLRTFYTL